jgi:hypothetical protein
VPGAKPKSSGVIVVGVLGKMLVSPTAGNFDLPVNGSLDAATFAS